MGHIQMEYYWAIKKNEIMLFATCMDLEITTLSEVSQRKINYHVTALVSGIFKNETKELLYKKK